MSKFNYIGSYLKSSSVQCSVISNNLISQERILVLAKGSVIELYKLCEDHLEHYKEQDFFSYIHCLSVLSGNTTESILVLTHQHHLFQYNNDAKVVQISLKLVNNPMNASKFLMKVNNSNSLLCIHDYSNYFRVFNVRNGKITEDGSLLIDNLGKIVKDFEFVNAGNMLAVLGLGENGQETLLYFYNLGNVAGGERKVFKFVEYPGKILTLPSDNLIIILTSTAFRVFDTTSLTELSQESEELGQITAKCLIDPTRWLFCNLLGKYFILNFGPTIEVKRVGVSIAAASIAHLDKNLFFLAGFENLSIIIEIKAEGNRFSLIEGKKFNGISCVNDFQLLDQNGIGEFNFLIASGHRLYGGLTKAYKSIMANTILESEIPNISNAWSIKVSSEFDSYFILSILSTTIVLHCPDSDLTLISPPDFHSTESTLTLFEYEDSILQVTPSGIFRYLNNWTLSYTKLSSEITQSSIILASGSSNTLVLATQDCSIFCFELTKNSVLQIWTKSFDREISGVQCNENFVAVSFWESNVVEIYEKYSGNRKSELGCELVATVKDMKFVMFGEVWYLFIGLRNGLLVYVNLSCMEVKKLNLGVHDVVLEEIQFKDKNYVLAASDYTIILYMYRGKITHSSLSIRNIKVISSFNTREYPNSILLAQKDKLLIINYEDLSKHSYSERIISQTVTQIHQIDDNYILSCQDISGRFHIKLVSPDFSELSSHPLNQLDHFISFELINTYLFVACTLIDKEKSIDLRSSIKIFSLANNHITLTEELFLPKSIHVFRQWQNFLIIGEDNLTLYKVDGPNLHIIESVKTKGKVVSLDSHNELLATVSLREYLSIYTLSHHKLLSLFRFNNMDSGKVVKFIDEKHLLVGDAYSNICVFELSGTFVNLVAGFNFEVKVPHKFVQMRIHEQVYGFEGICTALSTRTGNIFTIFSIPEDTYTILHCLQCLLVKHFQHFDKYLETVWQVKRRGIRKDLNVFINGDFLSKFELLPKDHQHAMSEKVKEKTGKFVNTEKLFDLIYSLSRVH